MVSRGGDACTELQGISNLERANTNARYSTLITLISVDELRLAFLLLPLRTLRFHVIFLVFSGVN